MSVHRGRPEAANPQSNGALDPFRKSTLAAARLHRLGRSEACGGGSVGHFAYLATETKTDTSELPERLANYRTDSDQEPDF
jgi:hypothetical protein